MTRKGLEKWVEEQGAEFIDTAASSILGCIENRVPIRKLWHRYPVAIWNAIYRAANDYGYWDIDAVKHFRLFGK